MKFLYYNLIIVVNQNSRQVFHPITRVQIMYPCNLSIFWLMNMTTNHTSTVILLCECSGAYFKICDVVNCRLHSILDILGNRVVWESSPCSVLVVPCIRNQRKATNFDWLPWGCYPISLPNKNPLTWTAIRFQITSYNQYIVSPVLRFVEGHYILVPQ